jgi:rod shape-determining protein MreC
VDLLWSRRFWAALATVAVLASALVLTARQGRLTRAAGALARVMAPAEAAAGRASSLAGAGVRFVRDAFRLRAENDALRQRVADLQVQVMEDEGLRQENARLRELLGLKRDLEASGSGPVLAAAVIGRNPDAWFDALVLGKGAAGGVRPGMVAVTPEGLVGRVVSATAGTATVVLVTNPDSAVGAMVETTRAAGVASGMLGSDRLTMRFFAPDPQVRAGDTVVTSGLGGVYPKGLRLGTVESVHACQFGLVVCADVRPAAPVDRLEDVLLLPPPGGSGP